MSADLEKLIRAAQSVPMTERDKETQRRSFAFGNTHFENAQITREMVDQAAEKIARSKSER